MVEVLPTLTSPEASIDGAGINSAGVALSTTKQNQILTKPVPDGMTNEVIDYKLENRPIDNSINRLTT